MEVVIPQISCRNAIVFNPEMELDQSLLSKRRRLNAFLEIFITPKRYVLV